MACPTLEHLELTGVPERRLLCPLSYGDRPQLYRTGSARLRYGHGTPSLVDLDSTICFGG